MKNYYHVTLYVLLGILFLTKIPTRYVSRACFQFRHSGECGWVLFLFFSCIHPLVAGTPPPLHRSTVCILILHETRPYIWGQVVYHNEQIDYDLHLHQIVYCCRLSTRQILTCRYRCCVGSEYSAFQAQNPGDKSCYYGRP